MHDQTRLLCNGRDDCRFQILCLSDLEESLLVGCCDDNSHSFLGFADGKFRAVQAFVLLRHDVQVDVQAVSQLADGNGNTARTEVIAPLDHAGCFAVAEQSLKFPLFRSVTLLHFCAAVFQ